MYKKSIFIFRQDLRTFDNKWLIKAINNSENLLPIFILDKNLIPDFLWLSDKKFLFLKEALLNLDLELKKIWLNLKVYHDFPEKIIKEISKKYNIEAIFTNKSYSRYWNSRDEKIELFCLENKIDFFRENDYLLVEPEEVEQRKVFTPYYKLWQKKLEEKWVILEDLNNLKIPKNIIENNNLKDFLDELIPWKKHPYFDLDFWKSRIENFDFSHYEDFRNNLDLDWTSRLSVFIRFWIFSIREVYLKTKEKSDNFISELAWREFWQHINYYFPFTKKYEFQENKRHIKWEKNDELFQKWCKWETGYPVVDAAMKQLVETNWMHGRARMIVASFLTKDLHIDWRLWEKFFKKYLIDYDENVNYWNWQWSASVWADPKPLRIFNPCLQSEKFDKNAKFIKKYIPSLENSDIKSIHNPIDNKLDYFPIIINHKIEQKIAREMYKKKD